MKTIHLPRFFEPFPRAQLSRKQLVILLLLLFVGFALIAIDSYRSHQFNTPLLAFLPFWLFLFFAKRIPASPANIQPDISYKLIFGRQHLVCRNGEASLWHIPYARISHLSTSAWLPDSETYQQAFFHTRDGDSFCLLAPLTAANVAAIEAELKRCLAVQTATQD